MKKSSTSLLITAVTFLLALPGMSFPTETNPGKAGSLSFSSSNTSGIIGRSDEMMFDSPVDNIFHIEIDHEFCPEDQVWLVYELNGVEDHTNVARSVNDQLSVGGYLVKKREGWSLQKERINPTWLRNGDNIIRFTIPEGADYFYKVRNIRIESARTEPDEPIVFNKPSFRYYFERAYVKGFLPGADYENVSVKVDGVETRIFHGEFESVIDFPLEKTSCSVEVEAKFPDGSTYCTSLTFSEPQNPDYIFDQGRNIYHVEKFFTTSQDQSFSLNGANLTAQAGALSENSMLSITSLRAFDIPALDAGLVNVTKGHSGFRFLPHGTTFLKDVEIGIPYDSALIPEGYTAQDVRTYYFDETSHHWVALTLDTIAFGKIVSKSLHFTDMIDGILKLPESPEAQAFNSTTIKGIQAATPTTGVNMINPPQASSTGSASLSYPITLPPGRKGVHPQLGLSYSSSSGNSWLGLGWNIMIPAITIETRWGVPRYDPAKETETYTMNGEMLTPVAHRGAPQARQGIKKQFYPRVEGAFQRIFRHGDSPANYWWEVTDKNGTKYSYGGSNGTFDPSAVLRTNEGGETANKGSVAHWQLREVRDLSGNTILYHYEKIPHAGVTGGKDGFQIYIKRITYTGYNGSDGRYDIVFKREREITPSTIRTDIQIMANLGFKQVTADRLKEIAVRYDGNVIRSYQLTYSEGVFNKTLLQKITEYDSKGNFFTEHGFEYYNEVGSGAEFKPLANLREDWNPHTDGVKGKFLLTKDQFTDKASALSGTKGKDKGIGLTVTAGLAADGNYMSKSLTVGGSFGYAESESEGLLTLIDIDGDGLTDKIFMKDGKLFYRSNPSGTTSNTAFGQLYEIPLPSGNTFYKEKSKSINSGLEANAGIGSFSAFVGKGKTKSTSTTSVYLTEVNGDQLPDLVVNGSVFFNRIDPATGRPSFTRFSNLTPSPITGTGAVASDIIVTDPAELEAAINENPLHDMVRMWRAPFDGRVKIRGGAQLIESRAPERATAPADGVMLKIQMNDNDVQLWSKRIQANDYSINSPTGLDNIVVRKGDRFFFRVQSVDNGAYDSVRWSPIIEYIAPGSDKPDTLLTKDANRKPLYQYDSKKDFVISARQMVSPPFNGTVRLNGDFKKPLTSDSIYASVFRINSSKDTTILWKYKGGPLDDVTQVLNETVSVDSTETLFFQVSSSTNVDWSKFDWRPHMYYVASADLRYPVTIKPDGKPDPLIEFYPIPEYSIFPNMKHPSRPWIVGKDITSVTITSDVAVDNPFAKGIVIFSVKKPGEILFKDTLHVLNGAVSQSEFTAETEEGDSLFVEYHIPDVHIANMLQNLEATVDTGSGDAEAIKAGVYTRFDSNVEQDAIYGTLYRNWGQFIYNGNREKADQRIIVANLKIDDKLKNAPRQSSIGNADELDSKGAYNPAADNFVVLTPRGFERVWGGYDPLTFLNAEVMSSSRMGEDDLSGGQAAGGTSRAVNKISKSESKSFSAGAGAGVVSGSYNRTNNAFSRVVVDFMDMNGDRYPDIVTDQKVQYTTPDGGMEAAAVSHGLGINHETISNSDGFSISGSFVMSKTEGSSSNARNTRTSVGNARVSGGISGNAGKGDNTTAFTWMDINGDGLPDKIFAGGDVSLNLGYSFLDRENWGFADIQKGNSTSTGGGLSINIGTGSQSASFAAGVGLALSENYIQSILQDMNGDGLIDAVHQDNGAVKVNINTGSGYSPIALPWNHVTEINKSSTASQSANVSFTGCFPIWIVKVCINPSVNAGNSVTRDLQRLSDMDGDGFPDYIESEEDDGDLSVYRSKIGKTNMLKRVVRPLGSSFEMAYRRVGNTYEMPNNVWVLDSVRVQDGFLNDGADESVLAFEYKGGYYDRHERDFYGFEEVITRTHNTLAKPATVYTVVTQKFTNDNYYNKGLMVSELMTDAAEKKFLEKENRYEFKDITSGSILSEQALKSDFGNAFPALAEAHQRFYEGQETAAKVTYVSYKYDKRGNIVSYKDIADEGEEDDVTAQIKYFQNEDLHLLGVADDIEVSANGAVVRKRTAVIDAQTGNVKRIRQFLSPEEFADHDMEWDRYGNLKKMTNPPNAQGQRFSTEYEYDNDVATYATKISNSYGYFSEATYSPNFGQLLTSTDINGNKVTYELDDVGRVKKVIGPYEKNGGYTILFEYFLGAEVPWASTKHFDPANPSNAIQTVTFVDGLGRVIQTKKDAAIFQGDGKPDKEMMAVTGRVKFDAFGRMISSAYAILEPIGTPGKFNRLQDNVQATEISYDVMNRTTRTVFPDNATSSMAYGFGTDRDGKTQFLTRVTDPNGKQTEQFTDLQEQVTATKSIAEGNSVWTSFAYSPMGEKTEAIDDLGNRIITKYDNFGRKVEYTHPDAGKSTFTYDLAGNVVEMVSANLGQRGQAILYKYDFERLSEIVYPENSENNVRYTYGKPGAGNNSIGRMVLQEDATGAQEFFYGPLGETVKNIRTIIIPQHDEQTYVTEWEYDTWNRLTSMVYPDGEKVTYTYNVGGKLAQMSGKKKNQNYAYVNQIGYDKFEQRVFLAYGNGTKMTYKYEEERRRLENMTAKTKLNRLFMDNQYEYDKVNNILSLRNTAPVPAANLMGGSSKYEYEYDDLYRLTSANGSFEGPNDMHNYELSMSYNSVGSILTKNQKHNRKGNVQKKTSYNLAYQYGESQPHAPVHIGERSFTYDANGNQTGWKSDVTGQRRVVLWDEEDRIRSVYDNGSQHHYIYDASGERILKGKTTGQRIFVNGEWKAGSGQMGNFTVYVNPYIVLKSGGYTKHYYIENQRIASKLGGGWDNTGKGPLKAGGDKVDYVGRAGRVFDGIVKNLKFLGADGQILTAGKSGKTPPGQIVGTSPNAVESFQYFYHPDHVGSTSFVTDVSGEVFQHLEYFAFGETFVEEHSNTDRTPYLFNGKELDEETNLYYYGARYYDPTISVWASVDPQADEFPGISPYAYSVNNPVNYVDPDGEAPNPINLIIDAMFRDFKGQTTTSLLAAGSKRGFWQTPGASIMRLGRIYEDGVIRSMGVTKNTKTFKAAVTSPKGVIPDMVGTSGHNVIDLQNPRNNKNYSFPNASFVDAKFKSLIPLRDTNNPDQIKGMIDALSSMKGGYVNGKWNPNIKASTYGAAILTLVTPRNAVIDPKVIEYATSKNVKVFQRFTEEDVTDPNRMRVAPNSIPLNMLPAEGFTIFLKAPGQSVEVNWDKK